MTRAAPVVPLQRPFRLSALRCEAHPRKPVTVVGIPVEDAAPLRCWCDPDCARTAGWPFLVPEPQSKRRAAT
jgi:hypothetical protein